MRKEKWECLYDKDNTLIYEGFTKNHKPCGAGTSYYPNGTIYQEGIFGVKGLLCGREYYPSGILRFEGVYILNRAYGPNYPKYGIFHSENGSSSFEGTLHYKVTGLGYPIIEKPEDFGPTPQNNHPDVPVLMWWEDRHSAR